LGIGLMLYQQSLARASIMGREETKNPSLAAKYVLGARRTRQGERRLAQYRRPSYRGNPAPAAIASVASALGLNLGGRFKAPSEKRAAKVVGAVVASALAGNLTAVKAIEHRAQPTFGLAKERAVWQMAWAQIPKKLRDALKKYADLVPAADHKNPETAAASALASPVDLAGLEAEAAEAVAMSKAERAAAAAASRAERSALLGTVADVGVAGLQAFAGRGRRPRTRRRRRRARRLSL